MSKGNKPPKRTQPPTLIKPIPISEPDKSNWWKRTFNTGWKLFLGCAAIIAFITGSFEIYDRCIKSDKDNADEETTWQGDLKPPPLTPVPTYKSTTTDEGLKVFLSDTIPNFLDTSKQDFPKIKGIHITDFNINKPIWIMLGENMFSLPPSYFYQGVDLLKTAGITCTNASIIMGLKDNRLYVSTEFKRLQNEETLGILEFNHWKVFRDNALGYPKENDTMLEVRDKQSKIAFSIKYGSLGFAYPANNQRGVTIRGYFIGDTSIVILNQILKPKYKPRTSCFSKSDSDWKQKSLIKISEIKSLW